MAILIDALRKMVDAPGKITEVTKAGNEFYFKYGTPCFSVTRRFSTNDIKQQGEYTFYVYPHWHDSTSELASSFDPVPADEIEMMVYHSNELSSTERELIATLYKAIQEKHLNIGGTFQAVLDA